MSGSGRSSQSVAVWLHVQWQSKLSELPWRGRVDVEGNGEKKVSSTSALCRFSLFPLLLSKNSALCGNAECTVW